ncbi:MAG: DUF1566 domain-containing protein, partial [Myxococcota bacterium]|nr:DUF1566 domain-containing protein [Myxococcota bacterium]
PAGSSGTASGSGAATSGASSGAAGSSGGAVGGVFTGKCQPSCGSHKWACWPMPNPPASGLANPASYKDLGNGAVLDNVTCLTWQKTPVTTPDTLPNNAASCASLATSNFAGYGDWRMPTRVEMASLVDFTLTKGDAISPTAFPGEPSGYYRTASDWYETITNPHKTAPPPNLAWIYGMSSGFTSNNYAATSSALVRCVRGNGAGEALDALAVEPPNHYTVAAGEVTDNYTGLIWQQTDSATPAGAAVIPWSSAAGTCSTLGLNGHTWRLPSLNELATLVNEALVAGAVNRTAFPNTKYGARSNNWYWASSTYRGSAFGWAINFDDGFTGYNAGAVGAWNYFTGAWVRCVR